jgi:hypothetical protein
MAQALLFPPLCPFFTDCIPQYWHFSLLIYPNRFPDASQIIIPFLGASLETLPGYFPGRLVFVDGCLRGLLMTSLFSAFLLA